MPSSASTSTVYSVPLEYDSTLREVAIRIHRDGADPVLFLFPEWRHGQPRILTLGNSALNGSARREVLKSIFTLMATDERPALQAAMMQGPPCLDKALAEFATTAASRLDSEGLPSTKLFVVTSDHVPEFKSIAVDEEMTERNIHVP